MYILFENVQKGDFAIPDKHCVYWLTPGKKYEILKKEEKYFMFKDDIGYENWCKPFNSSYLNKRDWLFEKGEFIES